MLFTIILSNSSWAGVAMCEQKLKSSSDVIYRVLADDNKSSIQLDSEVRGLIKKARGTDYKGYPSCSRFLPSKKYDGNRWVYKVAKTERIDYEGNTKITYAIGFGADSKSAEKDLIKDIGSGDWGWRRKDGYKIIKSGSFIEPDKDDACYQLVYFRDKQLIKQIDKEFRWRKGAVKSYELIERIRQDLESKSNLSKVIRTADGLIRTLNGIAKVISGYTPPGVDISHASGTMVGKMAIAYKEYGKSKNLKKAIQGDLTATAKVAASAVAMKSQPVGYALKVKATNIQMAIDILETTENDKEWRNVIGEIKEHLKVTEEKLNQLEKNIKDSDLRLGLINETKNFIDGVCYQD